MIPSLSLLLARSLNAGRTVPFKLAFMLERFFLVHQSPILLPLKPVTKPALISLGAGLGSEKQISQRATPRRLKMAHEVLERRPFCPSQLEVE